MNVLFTGGSGLLGSEVRKLRPGWEYPTHGDFPLDDSPPYDEELLCELYDYNKHYDCVIHAAAVTSPPKVDAEPMRSMQVNTIGTAWVVRGCAEKQIRLVYVSTDYVFRGDRGNYAEEDELHPVNKYAWSKLGGECAVRMYDKGLIVRGSFGPVPFPYDAAFDDQYTSRIRVDVFARLLVDIVEREPPLFGVVHIDNKRQTVYEYAKTVSPEKTIGRLNRSDVPFAVPRDTSLISTRKDLP